MKWLKRTLTLLALLSVTLTAAFFGLGPQWVDRASNRVVGDPGRIPTQEALTFHKGLIVGDLHADSALWGKDLLAHNRHGQVDLPKLLEGGAALQMFTTVTKSPRGQNYDRNASDAPDNISILALAQRWPAETQHSLFARALLQAVGRDRPRPTRLTYGSAGARCASRVNVSTPTGPSAGRGNVRQPGPRQA